MKSRENNETMTTSMPYLVLIAVFPLTYYITHSLMDYRQPIEPAILVLAVSGALPFRRLHPSRARAYIRRGVDDGITAQLNTGCPIPARSMRKGGKPYSSPADFTSLPLPTER
jgi:hypothetical protein